MKNDADDVFSGPDNSQPVNRQLVIASDSDQTITNSKLRPRQDYVKALMLLKLAGHKVAVFSSQPYEGVSLLFKKMHLPTYAEELGLTDEQKAIVLTDDFFQIQHKLDWKQVLDAEHVDLVFDDEPKVNWCNFSIHLVPDTQGFDTFVQAVLANPNQDINLLAFGCSDQGGELGNLPDQSPSNE